jgi:hypothetical protein
MNHLWDDSIHDPWYSTYGFQKEAEWKFDHAGERVTAGQLKRCAASCHETISNKFGEELATAFQKDPQSIFDSLPLDSKRIIMRVANEPS